MCLFLGLLLLPHTKGSFRQRWRLLVFYSLTVCQWAHFLMVTQIQGHTLHTRSLKSYLFAMAQLCHETSLPEWNCSEKGVHFWKFWKGTHCQVYPFNRWNHLPGVVHQNIPISLLALCPIGLWSLVSPKTLLMLWVPFIDQWPPRPWRKVTLKVFLGAHDMLKITI